ncbi:type II secretion system F family protein [Bacillus sp. FJAT-44742]|uniref:type II secretion system F family protein n=1 Tax=Bacillus sp. FJAT-44742 TaxID=2014005 RepID=UPI000C231132|nr:type II secretion system F family protein [Bacillus sp. FJAT-44742]
MTILLVLSVFLTSFLLLLSVTLFRAKKEAADAEAEKIREPVTIKGLLKNGNQKLKLLIVKKKKPSKKKDKLEQQLSVAGVPIKPEEFIVFQVFAILIAGGLMHLLTSQLLLMAAGGMVGYLMPKMWLKAKQKKRMKQFNEGLPGMITSITGSLRAGFSFPQSLQMVAEESYSPIREEVQLVLKSMQYGTTLEDALVEWKDRMPSEDLDLLVEAILIQRQVGGNLAYLLDKLVETTRERSKIEGQVKTLTAQGRLSGIIISLLPVGLGVLIYMMNPEYMGTLFIHPIGQGMLVAAVIGGVIGFFLVRKITTIEV